MTPAQLYLEYQRRRRENKIAFLFPEKGEDNIDDPESTWSAHLYPKAMEFFSAGKKYKSRIYLAGNRVGKSMAGAYEVVMHCTGLYPKNWPGKRYDNPRQWWAVSETSEMSVKTLQRILLGPVGEIGTGLIPKHLIDFSSLPQATKVGVGVSGVKIKHKSGGWSSIEFKAIQQGVFSFVGTTCSIWVDEALTRPIYEECETRITLGDNMFIHTFTPINGFTDQLQAFFGTEGYRTGELTPFKHCTSATIWDVPHIPEIERERLYKSWPEYIREARAKGIPQLGQGVLFPFSEEQITCTPFVIPDHWKKVAGLDVGWRAWASCWFAINPDDQKIYCYSSYKMGEKTPLQHWETLKLRGDWIPVACDPAAHGRGQNDGAVIFDQLQDFGMDISNADNTREAGIYAILELFTSGQLKIFSTEVDLVRELLNLSRDDKGMVKDASSKHMFDAFRYGVHTRDLAKQNLPKTSPDNWTPGSANRW